MGRDDDAALKSERLAEGQLKEADCLWITNRSEAVIEEDLLEFHTPTVSLVRSLNETLRTSNVHTNAPMKGMCCWFVRNVHMTGLIGQEWKAR